MLPARKALGRLLRAGGFEPALFESAEAYIDASPAPLCIVVDVRLPGMSGIELQQRLRAAGTAPPIIVTTASHEAAIRERAEQNGCAGFFWKPVDGKALIAAIVALATHSTERTLGDEQVDVAARTPRARSRTTTLEMVKAVSPVAGPGLRDRGKRRRRQRAAGGGATAPARRDRARPEPPERQRTGGVSSDHAGEPGDESDRVHGDERTRGRAGIVGGRRICVRVENGRRGPAFRHQAPARRRGVRQPTAPGVLQRRQFSSTSGYDIPQTSTELFDRSLNLDCMVPAACRSVKGMSSSNARVRGEGARRSPHKRSAILDAATEVFLRSGYLATSMDEVAARSTVSKQTVYQHFSTKEALLVGDRDGHDRRGGRRSAQRDSCVRPGPGRRRVLRGYALRQVTIVLTPRLMRLRGLVIGEVSRFPELAKVLTEERGPQRATRALAAMLQQLANLGLLTIDDPLVAASPVNWLMMLGSLNQAMLLGDDAIPKAAALRRHVAESVSHVPCRLRDGRAAWPAGHIARPLGTERAMQTIFNHSDLAAMLGRIQRLQPDAPRQWGKMTAADVLAHCSATLATPLGDRQEKQALIGRLIAPFIRIVELRRRPAPPQHANRRRVRHRRRTRLLRRAAPPTRSRRSRRTRRTGAGRRGPASPQLLRQDDRRGVGTVRAPAPGMTTSASSLVEGGGSQPTATRPTSARLKVRCK